jgi:hypothetical protein
VTLSEGRHSIVMTFNEGVGGAGMYVNVTPPGGTPSLLSNSMLYNADITAANPVTISASATIGTNTGKVSLGLAAQASSAVLTVDGGGTLSFTQSIPGGGNSLSYFVNANTTIRPGELLATDTVNASGPGTVLLDFTGAQLAGGTINVTGGNVVAATSPGGSNPLGSSTVKLTNGGSLGLTITAPTADTFNFAPVNVGTGGGSIRAGRFGVGPAGPQTMTYGAPISVTNNAPLGFSTSDGYTLALNDTVTSNGPISVTGGNVQTVSSLTGSTLSVTGGRLDTLGPLAFTGGTTVAPGGTLRLNSNAYTGGAINVKGTLEFNGNSNGTIPAAVDGGKILATSGVADFTGQTVAGTAPVVTTNANVLSAKSYSLVNPAGGFGSEQGLAVTLAAQAALTTTLANRDLNFGTQFNADPVYNAFFGGQTGDAFTASFTGKFTAPASGPFTFGRSINDDGASIWIDINQNGLFERSGSGGDERISHQDLCCGPATADATENAVVNLVQGQAYNMVFIVQDTGGGSSFAAKWDQGNIAGPGGLSKFVNPGDAAQAGIWSTTQSVAGGANLEVAAGAELRGGAFTNVTDAYLNGTDAKLTFNASPAVASNIGVLRNSTGTSMVEVTAGNTVTVDHLVINQGTTIRKLGSGTIVTPGLSVGNGGFLLVEAGVVVDSAPAVSTVANNTPGGIVVSGTGTFDLEGALSGTMQVNAGGTFKGSGTLGALTVDSLGVVAPGATPGTVGTLTTQNLALLGSSTLSIDLVSPVSTDQFNVKGTVFLFESTLSASAGAGFSPAPNAVFPLIINDLDDPVDGTFAGLIDGASLSIGGIPFNITYSANLDGGLVGNDVALIAVPEPGSAVLLLGGFGMLIGAQRLRRKSRS